MYEFVNCAIKSPLHSKPSDTSKLMQTSYCIDVLIYTYRCINIYIIKINTVYWVRLQSALKLFAGIK